MMASLTVEMEEQQLTIQEVIGQGGFGERRRCLPEERLKAQQGRQRVRRSAAQAWVASALAQSNHAFACRISAGVVYKGVWKGLNVAVKVGSAPAALARSLM
jgi:hypothetical protein